MNYRLNKYFGRLNASILLESSKSESNRALLINALTNDQCLLEGLSNARDTQTMVQLLQEKGSTWDVKDAGTTMRFCTAYLAIYGEGDLITGTDRMKNRPIGPLVESLQSLGAEIQYLEKKGCPPLRITRIKSQKHQKIEIPGNISSQYISALLMIAPTLEKGLEIELTTEVFSRPYIEMTLSLMDHFGVSANWSGNKIKIAPQEYCPASYKIEGDWSGASYWYSMVALAKKGAAIRLSYLKEHSFQGDQRISNIMENLGVDSEYIDGKVIIRNTGKVSDDFEIDFRDCPDLAQTVLVCAAALGCSLHMTGLESLRIKETDRISAMQGELAKIGAQLIEKGATWQLTPTNQLPDFIQVETYEDHRMAMAFAPLCQRMNLEIKEVEVVNKSYPGFWDHLQSVGVLLGSS